jgi:hypothetical protein
MLSDDNAQLPVQAALQEGYTTSSEDEHLARGPLVREVLAARATVRLRDPDCFLLQLVDVKLAQLAAEVAPSPWAA